MSFAKPHFEAPSAAVPPGRNAAFPGNCIGFGIGFGWVRSFSVPHCEQRAFHAKWVRLAFSLLNPVTPPNRHRDFLSTEPPARAGNLRGIIQFSHHSVPEVKSTWH